LHSSLQFLDWLEPGVHADLVNGNIFMHSPVSLRHADVVHFLARLMGDYVEEFSLGKIFHDVVAVRLGPRDTFLPDLLFLSNEQVGRLGTSHVDFAPLLVIEVLSPATAKRDLKEKFSAYEAHGVQEYWVIDPDKAEHRFYRRAGEYLDPVEGDPERIESSGVPGFWIRKKWLADASALPSVAACLAELRAARKRRR
jgi:Uma2 family endonuclease